jgi:hypothetical protein
VDRDRDRLRRKDMSPEGDERYGGGGRKRTEGLPPPEGGGRHDINELLMEEERRLKEELEKRRADLGSIPLDGGGMDMSLHEPPAGSLADMQRQINALVTVGRMLLNPIPRTPSPYPLNTFS